MSSIKRRKSDSVESHLQLPLVDDALTEEGIWKLRNSVCEYRRAVDELNSTNEKLSLENNRLRRLCSNIGSLWDFLNEEVESVVASACIDREADPSSCATNLVNTLLSTKFPILVKESAGDDNEADRCVVIESDTLSSGVGGRTHPESDDGTVEAKDDLLLKEEIEEFNTKKQKLLTHVKRLEGNIREYAQRRYSPDMDEDIRQKLESEQFKDRVLELSTRLLCDSVAELREDLNAKTENGRKLEVEVSRLSKLNAELRHQLYRTQEELNSRHKDAPDTADTTEDPPTNQEEPDEDTESDEETEKAEEITTGMVVASEAYSRLFEHAKKLDDEVTKLEKENSSLRTKMSRNDKRDDQAVEMFTKYEQIFTELSQRIEDYESKIAAFQEDITQLKLQVERLSSSLEDANREKEHTLEELKLKDRRLHELVATSAKISKSFADYTSSNVDPTVADYQEQLKNLAEELDEISGAFEEKIRFSEGLLLQLKEAKQWQEKYSSMDASYNAMQEKYKRMGKAYEKRLEAMQTQVDTANRRVEAYRESWIACFKRAAHFEERRNEAVAALCESQSMYRRCFREKKELLHHFMQLRSQGSLTGGGASGSGEAAFEPGSSLANVMQENEVLRRRMTCTVCCENFRNHCITQCGHVFCKACITNNISSRNRKCPVCKVSFDKNDIQRIFLD